MTPAEPRIHAGILPEAPDLVNTGPGARLAARHKPGRVSSHRKNRAPSADGPRVYLHIGEPKTGTTFLQDAMWRNRSWLADRGVVLPGFTHQDHSRASRDLRGAARLASYPAEPWTGEWGGLTRQALCARHTAVISDELLAACTTRQADRAVKSLLAAEVHIILTVRDLATGRPRQCSGMCMTRWPSWTRGRSTSRRTTCM